MASIYHQLSLSAPILKRQPLLLKAKILESVLMAIACKHTKGTDKDDIGIIQGIIALPLFQQVNPADCKPKTHLCDHQQFLRTQDKGKSVNTLDPKNYYP